MSEPRSKIPKEIERKVLLEARHCCAICKQIPIEIHHIEPWEKVKEHKFENLIALCPTCHSRCHKGLIDKLSQLTYKKNLTNPILSESVIELSEKEKNFKRSTIKLRDEIYIDRNRIETYLQQIHPDKINQNSYYAKIIQILQYLENTNDIVEGRPNQQGKDIAQFRLENCLATRAYFEPNHHPSLGFNIWVSQENEKEKKSGKLFLLENSEIVYQKYKKRISSPYSFLYELGWILENKLESVDKQQLHRDDLAEELVKDPLKALKNLGAKIYQERKISVLYKIRNLFPEFYSFNYKLTTIAYPILIVDNWAENNLKLQDILHSI